MDKTTVIYIENFVAFEDAFGVKITSKDNFEKCIMNAGKVMSFNGSLNDAVEYIKTYFSKGV